ncbi:CubicO group peptidase (beta-lactamase class C family) [Tenacibaculum gallaicum]|uniref:CubicO group peptidase (Beta-lactamase class C family) n=1 Tax=Tenacibaculum gallaicum TaxID=561505 RepID=A0A3E0HR41_9FLAO|nr:serine hydrolase [Tenacibaculum gallaicum]REH48894.1 CubicO group peptidase (beta-lactamase class C family) [Tenacibaculum gallaicum]
MNIKLIIVFLITFLSSQSTLPCTMYKITKNGRTIVGNNEDFLSPNNQFWFEVAGDKDYGVMYMGLLNNFAQGAINDAGLVFDGFAEPELPIVNTEGKKQIWVGKAIKNIMQTMSTVEEVKGYLETINLSSLSSSQLVFVDKSGTYLIVEGDELIIGEESEKSFSNFYYSQINSLEDVTLPWFNVGQEFLKKTTAKASLNYCSNVMKNYKQVAKDLFSTQFTTVYDLSTLKIRVYLYHDFTEFIEIDLKQELKKGNHNKMMVDLFSETSLARKFYDQYNDSKNPISFLQEQMNPDIYSEKELLRMEFNETISILGYEWLNQKKNPDAAIKIFKYGVTLMPNNTDLYDSLGEAYLINNDWTNAIKNYAKSLALNPENDNAIDQLVSAKNDREQFKVKKFKQLADLIDQYAEATLKNGNINSIALAVYKNGLVYQNYYGEIDKGANNKPSDSSEYEIASITKTFTGALVAKAVLGGKLNLDDDIRKYLDGDYSNLEYQGQAVTIKNLLTHSIGFDDEDKNGLSTISNKINRGALNSNEVNYTIQDFFDELKSVKISHQPGTVYDYNSVGPELLAYILEKVNKTSYINQLDVFLKDLGMHNTYMQGHDKTSKNLVNGYANGNLTEINVSPLYGAAGGAISTLPDLTIYIKYLLEHKDEAWVKEASRSLFVDEEDDENIGYLWQNIGYAEEEGYYYSKTGTSNGVQSGVLICPDSDYGMVVIVNNTGDKAFNDWGTLFFRDIEPDVIKYPKINLYALTKPDFIRNKTIGLAKFNTLMKQKDAYYNTDLSWCLNNIGYELLNKKENNQAIEMFEFAIEQDPENANLYDSLGEAYFIAKEYNKSLLNYEKSLKLNPKNDNAKAYIDKIKKKLKR